MEKSLVSLINYLVIIPAYLPYLKEEQTLFTTYIPSIRPQAKQLCNIVDHVPSYLKRDSSMSTWNISNLLNLVA